MHVCCDWKVLLGFVCECVNCCAAGLQFKLSDVVIRCGLHALLWSASVRERVGKQASHCLTHWDRHKCLEKKAGLWTVWVPFWTEGCLLCNPTPKGTCVHPIMLGGDMFAVHTGSVGGWSRSPRGNYYGQWPVTTEGKRIVIRLLGFRSAAVITNMM